MLKSKSYQPKRKLRILATQYTLATKSLEIYTAGCSGNPYHCEGCHNPESWNFDQGDLYNTQYFIKRIRAKVIDFPELVKNIMIFGGEPLDSDISELLFECNIFRIPIWLFTHYDLDDVPQYVKNYCTYIKTGRYVKSLVVDDNVQYGIKLASLNQNIYKRGVDYCEGVSE
jgi:anaerobic ribonucleoside-triphosphate reductase activating protein